ncbi:S-layer homology domain-containing protein [Paenibacillus sp. N3/727]|uniref:S-layer homology domain-containing protein n=1 Tax=Paenibacillus sp. N3/727 TaxID=2925845 RepID=UPI001F52D487|nr:S-layer homology domain-containing protein [Paenibacillus sp. N3/727]UNK17674.1 S-layer homology domain-containing protein [Paenibacillus sp. N3/727]
MMKMYFKSVLVGLIAVSAVFPFTGIGEVSAATKFKDVPANHWAKDAIYSAVNKGYFKGYGKGIFKPNATVTRAEFAVLMARVSKEIPATEKTDVFNDLKNHWSKKEVDRAVSLGFINPSDYPNGFKPNTALTREEMAKWLSSGLAAVDKDFKQALADTKSTLIPAKEAFKPGISQASVPYIAVAMGTNLMSGYPDGSFGLKKTTTRAETSAILLRLDKVSTQSATSFADLNELRMLGTKKTNLELVTPFTTGNTSFADVAGKKNTFRNSAGSLVFHRMVAVNTQKWNDKKSIYAPFFIDESNKAFLTERKNVYPVYLQITIYPKSKEFDVDHYYSGISDFTGGAPITNDLPDKFGYYTLPRMNTKSFFANRPNGVTLWVTQYLKDGNFRSQVDMDDGSVVYLKQK